MAIAGESDESRFCFACKIIEVFEKSQTSALKTL